MNFTLSKNEKLKSRKTIAWLFAQRRVFGIFPLRVFFAAENNGNNTFEVKAGFGCSKKYFKQAVRRNRAKRLMREAYRTQKEFLVQEAAKNNTSVYVFFLFANHELTDYRQIQTAMMSALQRMAILLRK